MSIITLKTNGSNALFKTEIFRYNKREDLTIFCLEYKYPRYKKYCGLKVVFKKKDKKEYYWK